MATATVHTTHRPPDPGSTGRASAPPGGARARHLAAAATALALLALLSGCGASSGGTAVGAAAVVDQPVVQLADGEETTLLEVADGRPLVVNLWASWCVPCLEEMPAFDEVHRARGGEVAIVGVTDDTPEDARRMAERTGVTYPLLLDDTRAVARDLGVAGLPLTVFVAADGEVLGRHQGALDAAGLEAEIDRHWGGT